MRLPFRAKIAAGLLFVVAALWLTELVPLVAAALLIPVIVVLAGINDATTILQPFAHPIIILFLSGFLLAEGMKLQCILLLARVKETTEYSGS